MTPFYRFYHYLARFLYFTLARRCVVRGVEHVPRSGPVILVCNHVSMIDPVLAFAYLPRQVYFMAKIEVFEAWPLRWLAPRAGAFPVHRGKVDRAALRRAEELLAQGHMIGLYPEGHRSADGHLQDARGGVVLLAQRCHAPILPVALTGTEQVFHATFPWWRPATVTLTIGPAFTLEELAAEHGLDLANRRALADRALDRVAAMLPPAYQRLLLGDQPASLRPTAGQPVKEALP